MDVFALSIAMNHSESTEFPNLAIVLMRLFASELIPNISFIFTGVNTSTEQLFCRWIPSICVPSRDSPPASLDDEPADSQHQWWPNSLTCPDGTKLSTVRPALPTQSSRKFIVWRRSYEPDENVSRPAAGGAASCR